MQRLGRDKAPLFPGLPCAYYFRVPFLFALTLLSENLEQATTNGCVLIIIVIIITVYCQELQKQINLSIYIITSQKIAYHILFVRQHYCEKNHARLTIRFPKGGGGGGVDRSWSLAPNLSI